MTPARICLLSAIAMAWAPSAQAQTPPRSDEAAITACRTIETPSERLACYDREVAAFETARATGALVVLKREDVEESQRRAFGFDVNILNPFGRDGSIAEIDSITSTLKSARQVGSGQKWLVDLEDGSSWLQIDSTSPYVRRTTGQEVRIRRASLGSYIMSVGSSAGFRVRRQVAQ